MNKLFSIGSFHDAAKKTQTADGIFHKDMNQEEKQGFHCHME